jgi:cytoskeleton protein RodZ
MASFGLLLRRTREQRGVSLDDVARETRLSKRYLVALEEETLSTLPGGTYNRAYLRSYATFLALDPDALVRDYVAEEERQTTASPPDLLETMNRAIDGRQSKTDRASGGRWPTARTTAFAGIALVVSAGIVWYGLSAWRGGAEPVVTSAAVGPVTIERTPAPSAPPASAPPTAASAMVPGAVAPALSVASTVSSESIAPRGSTPGAAVALSSEARSDPASAVNQSRPPVTTTQLSVAGSGVGTAVIDRQLVGRSDRFAAGSQVVFWTRVVGGRAGDTVDHVWLHDGSIVAAASLTVGSPDWRTQSRRVLDPAGRWAVEARDADGRVLARHEFQSSAQ